MRSPKIEKIASLLICVALLTSCNTYRTVWHPKLYEENLYEIDPDIPFIKCHMKNHEVYLLSDWSIFQNLGIIQGTGSHHGVNRELIEVGSFSIKIDEVVLIETNHPEQVRIGGLVAMNFMLGLTTVVGILCLTNPKACFGSCPTYYAHDGYNYVLQAEGFSSSIAPALERSDIDALYEISHEKDYVEIMMCNEALETHVVNSVDLLAINKPSDKRVYQTSDDRFFSSGEEIEPLNVVAEQGEITALVTSYDKREYSSETDGEDLSSKELIEVEFPQLDGQLALVASTRNTLLNTYLMYQTIAYMGQYYSDFLMSLDRENSMARKKLDNLSELLGFIEVFIVDDGGREHYAGRMGETGPIARQVSCILLPNDLSDDKVNLRLKMTKGNWRIDHLALVKVEKEVEPLRIEPSVVMPVDGESDAWDRLTSEEEYLFTYPGDKYILKYKLPEGLNEPELFLCSRGYYYEWLREEWVAEQDLEKLTHMMSNPHQALRDMAPSFKAVESEMDEHFWNSKYAK